MVAGSRRSRLRAPKSAHPARERGAAFPSRYDFAKMRDLIWLFLLVGVPLGCSFAMWQAVNRKPPQRHMAAKIVATAVLFSALAAVLVAWFTVRDIGRMLRRDQGTLREEPGAQRGRGRDEGAVEGAPRDAHGRAGGEDQGGRPRPLPLRMREVAAAGSTCRGLIAATIAWLAAGHHR